MSDLSPDTTQGVAGYLDRRCFISDNFCDLGAMSKVASVISVEFETPEEVAGFTKYVAEKQVDFSKDLEQLTAVRTGDTSMMVIQVHPDQESYDRYEADFEKIRQQNPFKPTDRVRLQGDVTYMVHHTTFMNV